MSLMINPAEFHETIDFGSIVNGALKEVPLTKKFPLNKDIWGVQLEYLARIAVTVAAPGAVLPEAPQNILSRVRVYGEHNKGTREPLNLHGATLYQVIARENVRNPRIDNGGLANAVGNYDVRILLTIPLVPTGVPVTQQARYMIHGDDWKALTLAITHGDRGSIFDAATGTVAFSGFGGTGNPTCHVSLIRPNLGPLRNRIRPAIYYRTFKDLTTILTASSLSDALITSLNVGKKLRGLVVKTGVKATVASPSDGAVYTSLSDGVITRAFLNLDGKRIRNPITTASLKEWYADRNQKSLPTGYFEFDFAEGGPQGGGDMRTSFPADGLTDKNNWELRGDVAVAANQQGEAVSEEVEGVPEVFIGGRWVEMP